MKRKIFGSIIFLVIISLLMLAGCGSQLKEHINLSDETSNYSIQDFENSVKIHVQEISSESIALFEKFDSFTTSTEIKDSQYKCYVDFFDDGSKDVEFIYDLENHIITMICDYDSTNSYDIDVTAISSSVAVAMVNPDLNGKGAVLLFEKTVQEMDPFSDDSSSAGTNYNGLAYVLSFRGNKAIYLIADLAYLN